MAITATEWLLTPNRWHKLTIDTNCIYEQLSVITDLLVIFHLQDTIARISNQLTKARSCNLCIPVRHTWFPQGIIYQGQLAMTPGSRGQLHINVLLCPYTIVSKYHRAISHHIFTSHWCIIIHFVQIMWHSKFMEEFPYTKTLNMISSPLLCGCYVIECIIFQIKPCNLCPRASSTGNFICL